MKLSLFFRMVRKRWRALTPEEKALRRRAIWNARWKIAGGVGLVGLAAAVNFVTHLQETPVTKRRRFIAFTDAQFLKLAKYNYEMVSFIPTL